MQIKYWAIKKNQNNNLPFEGENELQGKRQKKYLSYKEENNDDQVDTITIQKYY